MDRWITDWTPSERWPHYTRANAGEVLPTPATPLGQEFSWDNGILLGWRDGYVRSGNYNRDEFTDTRPHVAGFFGGYFYINLSNVRMQGVRNPAVTVEQLDLAFFGDHPEVPPYTAHPDDERPEFTDRINAHSGWLMTATTFPEIDDEKQTTKGFASGRPDLSALSDAELVLRARATQPMLQKLFESHTITSSGSGLAPGILFAVGQAIGDPTVPMTLVAGIGDVDSAEPNYALWDLSRMVRASTELTAAFDAGVDGLLGRLQSSGSTAARDFLTEWNGFVREFGSRGPNEWEISAHTWETKPEIALAALDRVRLQQDAESPRARNSARAAERVATTADVRSKLAAMGDAGAELAGMFEAALIAANQLAFRERTKTNIIRIVHEGRMVFRELGRRHHAAGNLQEHDHVFMLLNNELEAFVANPGSMTATLADRYANWQTLWDVEPPFFIKNGEVPPISKWTKRGSTSVTPVALGEVLQGVPGCPGVARGRARVILDPSDPLALEPGDVLIAPLTDPAWTPLFMPAAAVVVNVGGQISHAIIVSRELGLPCVVSATDATRRIPDGALVEVNGTTGQVTVIELP
jgi:rifampicin phosphotransferase